MSARLRSFLRDFLAVSAGDTLSKVAGFLAFAYLARALTPDAYGAVELAVAVGMIGYLVVDFGAGATGARWVTRDRSRAAALARAIPTIRSGLALLAFLGACIAAVALGDTEEGRWLIVAYGAALLAAPWILDWLFQGLDRIQWVAPAQLTRMVVFAGCVVLFVDDNDDLLRVGLIEIVAFGTMAAYYAVAARAMGQRPGLSLDRPVLRELWKETVPVGLGQVLWALNQYLPTFLVASLLSSREVAFYGAAHRVVFSLGSFIFLYFFTLYPSLVRATHERVEDFAPLLDHSMRATAWLGLGSALVATILAGPLCRLAFGDRFDEAAPILAVLVWALPINLLSGHARFALIAAGEQRRHMWAQAAGVGVTVAAAGLGVGWFGPIGAAYGLLVSALAVWVLAHIATARHIAPLPSLQPLWRPVTAAALVLGAAFAFPLASPWHTATAAGGGYLVAGALLERRSLRALPTLLGRGGATGSESNP